MTETAKLLSPSAAEEPTSLQRASLNGSLILSSAALVGAIVLWWVVRFSNETAAEEGGRVRDLLNINWGSGPLPFVLFVTFAIGTVAAVLALMGANAARSAPWRAVLAGMMSAAILMVPVITVASSLVTAGIWNYGGD
jgi:hypothetical protein